VVNFYLLFDKEEHCLY